MSRPLLAVLLALGLASASCSDDHEDCPSGQAPCNGVCRDAAWFQTDAENCGACGVVCGAGACAGGVCQCDPGASPCPGNPRCADTRSDENNCGGCGVACTKPGSTCEASACGCHAPASADCLTYCADVQSDASNCNACGSVCPLTNDVCVGGACRCPVSLPTQCGNTCVDTLSDPQHCGPAADPASCTHVCPLANEVCSAGLCECPASFAACLNACVDLRTDEQNCGACGEACPPRASCTGTTPHCECPAGETLCGASPGACVSTVTDARNCGGCGNLCASGPCCASGCCAGTACCPSGGCQTAHSNGVNASYYDCGALDQHTAAQARLAAEAWSPSGTTFEFVQQCGTPFCLCRQDTSGAAVWCYQGSPMKGRVQVTGLATCATAVCPFGGAPATDWH